MSYNIYIYIYIYIYIFIYLYINIYLFKYLNNTYFIKDYLIILVVFSVDSFVGKIWFDPEWK